MNEKQKKSVPHQELEVLEKYLLESPEHEIQEAAYYIFERVKLNILKLQNTGEEALAPRFKAVFERVKKYLSALSPDQIREHYEVRKRQTLELIQTLSPSVVKNSPKYIVSLTSYGKRLTDTAPYAITTLLNQNVKPDNIILWVAHEDNENIPQVMNLLIKKGLEIRFCENIKSYKKLIFTLSSFPDDYIITADDDVYYPQEWFEQLLNEHKRNPVKIICHRAHGIKVDENHNPLPYKQWHICINPEEYFANTPDGSAKHFPESIFPTGGAGTLYPPKSLHPDVLNKELFTKLAPHADDIWFWAMAVINKEYFGDATPYITIKNSCCSAYLQTVDPEQMQGKNALWNYNSQGGNDKQLKTVIENYPQIKEYLQKIEPNVYTKPYATIYGSRVSKDMKKGNIFEQILFLKQNFAYYFAKEHVKNAKTILDYGCGDGYGSDFIAQHFPESQVFGVDIDEYVIEKAIKKYIRCNLCFGSVDNIHAKFDLIISCQVIEHVEDVENYLKYLKSILNENGKVIITTPDRNYRLVHGQAPWNKEHLREYNRDSFKNDIKNVFPKARIYQLSGEKNMLRIEYLRISQNRADRQIYGGQMPVEPTRKYTVNDFFLSEEPLFDSVDLFAVISDDKLYYSEKYWEQRYAKAGNSGSGSYGRLAEFKAKIVNEFVLKHNINSVIEFGHGDGNQLALAKYPHYLGFDVSETAVKICKDKFANDKTKDFRLTSEYNGEKAELVLSLDVIYHLIEDIVFEDYMKRLFEASTKYVIVYSSNVIAEQHAAHVKHRKFTDWVENKAQDFKLLQFIPNKYPANNNENHPTLSFADFYVFGR